MPTILIVDDEEDIRELLKYNLKKEGYTVKTAKDGLEGLELAKTMQPNLILLDIMMPNLDGIETCRRIRENKNLKNAFIVFLTARSEEYSETVAFEVGADDYIIKPIRPRALISRIQAIFRRSIDNNPLEKDTIIEIGNLYIDQSSYTVKLNKQDISLAKKEFELLFFLAKNPEKIFSREVLLDHVWGVDVYVLPRTVDVHIRKVREKIGNDFITTKKGIGYKFSAPE